MKREIVDVLVSGGGIAGLTAAISFGNAGFSVMCIEPNAPVVNPAQVGADFRSTAFLQPAKTTLENAGLWQQLASYATPLQIMRLADAGGVENEIRHISNFDAAEISDQPFAWNLPNWLLRREMTQRIAQMDNVTLLTGQKTGRVTTRTDHALVQVDQQQIKCKLVIGADGRNSGIRSASGINVKTWRYGQKALSFAVKHVLPHDNVSTEIHRTGGPFTTVPLPDFQGQHYSSVIWMETGENANHLLAMDTDAFNIALNARSCNILGAMALETPRNIWPIISQMSDSMIAQRTALVAEAAHVVPPIGAQGLNMSLSDIECLLTLAIDNPAEIGSDDQLDAYQSARAKQIKLRVHGVDALNRAAMMESPNLRDLRLKGLQTLHGFAPLRKNLMQRGLG